MFGKNRKTSVSSFYEITDSLIDGSSVSMKDYKDHVLVVVNVASKWGLTKREYTQMAKLAEEFYDQGLRILLFPCNQFGGQEPGTPDEIMATASKFGATKEKFVFFEKADVNGKNSREVFAFLKEKLPFPDGSTNVMFNFGKFLVDHKGIPRERFGSTTAAITMKDSIEKLLKEQKEGK